MQGSGLRVIIAGGGTGGHVFPGIAVARELLARRPDARVTFVGTARGLEARVVPREGFELDVIRTAGLKGKSFGQMMRGASLLPLGLVDAWRTVARRRPQLVIGVGGYSSGPVVLMAACRGVPTMLLEQNAVPGLTNRLLAPVVKVAAVTYESTAQYFGAKAVVTGNPVRPEFVTGSSQETVETAADRRGVRLLVFGGSQGAHAINLAMVEAASRLSPETIEGIVHQAGERDVALVRAAYERAGLSAEVEPFLYDMGARLETADLVVCRAGATTLAELTAAGRAAILIPLPTATDDHQRKNAEALAAQGAAQVLLQSEAMGEQLAAAIEALARDAGGRRRMAAAARAQSKVDAARLIVDRALALVA